RGACPASRPALSTWRYRAPAPFVPVAVSMPCRCAAARSMWKPTPLPPASLPRMERVLPATCDHVLWGVPELGAGIAALAELTGVRAAPGGQHPDLGTHNAIAALGRKRFLEVLAPDPTLQRGA